MKIPAAVAFEAGKACKVVEIDVEPPRKRARCWCASHTRACATPMRSPVG